MIKSNLAVLSLALLVACTRRSVAPISIEAEQFNRGTVVVDKGEYGYGQGVGIILTPKPPAFAEYDIACPRTMNYDVEIRYSSGAPRPLRLLVDGQLLSTQAAGGNTGGFDPGHQTWQSVGVMKLMRGKHNLRLESDGVFPHVDQIRLTPTEKAEAARP